MGRADRIRWSDNDRYWGPFTYSRDMRRFWHFAVILGSGCGEEGPARCRLRLAGFGQTLIIALPPIVRPYREKVVAKSWDKATIERLGRDWYWNTDEREFGFSYSEGFFHLRYGRQSHDSRTEKSKGYFLPWTQWRHVRHSMYGLDGALFWTAPKRINGQPSDYAAWLAAEDACPTRSFAFKDFDGEALTVSTRIEEREWRFGEGWFKWLSLFRRPKVRRSLDLRFSGETGKRKGSWKGGTIGHSIDMQPGELHEAAFRRYCDQNNMTFVDAHPAGLTEELDALIRDKEEAQSILEWPFASVRELANETGRLRMNEHALTEERDRLREAAEKAYALLWRSFTIEPFAHQARGVLLHALGKDGQRSAIAYAIKELPEVSDREILSIDVPAQNDALIQRLTSSPIIEGLTPTMRDMQACVTVGDTYEMMKARIKATLTARPTP